MYGSDSRPETGEWNQSFVDLHGMATGARHPVLGGLHHDYQLAA